MRIFFFNFPTKSRGAQYTQVLKIFGFPVSGFESFYNLS